MTDRRPGEAFFITHLFVCLFLGSSRIPIPLGIEVQLERGATLEWVFSGPGPCQPSKRLADRSAWRGESTSVLNFFIAHLRKNLRFWPKKCQRLQVLFGQLFIGGYKAVRPCQGR